MSKIININSIDTLIYLYYRMLRYKFIATIILLSIFYYFIFIFCDKINDSDFWMYISSSLENEWINDLYNYEMNNITQYCEVWKKYKLRLFNLKSDISKCKYKGMCLNNDLSYFIFKKNNIQRIEYIEPLFGILRNTFFLCMDKKNISSKDYLLPSKIVREKRVIILDAGATTFAGGQNYFYDYYKKVLNTNIYNWILWEVKKLNNSNIPSDIKHVYNYNNRPINNIKESKDNPLFYIEKYKKKYSLIFKLDVDNPSVELPIFNLMLSHQELCPNEFYFEYHFNTPLMKSYWGNNVDKSCSLLCATQKFLQLRKRGIFAHAWT